jgi:hypothetical protein
MDWLNELSPQTLGMLIPIVAIIVGGIVLVTKTIIRHRERLAMIEKGMHPDHPPGKDE